MQDRNFDGLGDRFAQNIYGSPKGIIRQAILWCHLENQLPELTDAGNLRVLDAGCGLGQLSARLVKLGHQLTLCDVSSDMLYSARCLIEEDASQKIQAATPEVSPVVYCHSSLQEMAENLSAPFPIVLCHAVLEWLVDTEAAIAALAKLVESEGQLSLTFYNRDALIYRNLLNGNLRKVKSRDYAGHPGGLTPSNPLDPAIVFEWLDTHGFEITFKAGVRVFYDFIPRSVREKLSLDDVIELEQEYGLREPYSMLARYIHVVARRRPKI